MADQSAVFKTQVKRSKDRANYDREVIHSIIDEAFLCHVGFCDEGVPYVIPMAFARHDDILYLHGSSKARIAKALDGNKRVCVTFTHLDGLVLAKSYFHHSMNYRSAVLFGSCRIVDDPDELYLGFEQLMIHLTPGQERRTRGPNKGELKATSLLAFDIQEATAKIRKGPPKEGSEDADINMWTGVLPLALTAGEPITEEGAEVPENVLALKAKLSP